MPDIFGGIKDAVSAIVPDPVEDALFGHDTVAPAPTDPEAARRAIDGAIGRQPTDAASLRLIDNFGLLAKAVQPDWGGIDPTNIYSPDQMAQLATNNRMNVQEPYMLADTIMGKWLQDDPRRQYLFIRQTDPTNPEFMKSVMSVETNMNHHDGLLSNFKNMAGDVLGRPIGGALDLLTAPSSHVETWYGSNFVWNDIADASLRHAMSKYTYESRLNIKDWNMSWESKARAEARNIENQGLHGDAAAAAFKDWVKTEEGHPKVSAYITDAIAGMVLDPLWLLPGEWFAAPVKAASRALIGTEDVSKLARLGTSAGRAFAAEHTLKELISMPELAYATAKLSSPGARGSLLYLTERNPARLADAAARSSIDLIATPMMKAADPFSKMRVLQKFSDVLKTGKLDEEGALLFGKGMLDDPVLAEASVYLQKAGARSPFSGVLEGLMKNDEYLRQLNPEELNFALRSHFEGNLKAIVQELHAEQFPKWFSKHWLPVVATQKMMMGIFTISRPGFVALNLANNMFTYMWHAAGHPIEGAEIFARSFGAEFSASRQLPEYFRGIAKGAGVDAHVAEHFHVGNVSNFDTLGQVPGTAFRLDDEVLDVADAIKKIKMSVAQPLKDMSPRRLRDLVAWPVTVAGRVDRVARRASYYSALKEQLRLISAPERLLLDGVTEPGMRGGLLPDIKDALLKDGVSADLADKIEHTVWGHMSDALTSGRASLDDVKSLQKEYMAAIGKATNGLPASRLNAHDLGMRFMAGQSYGPVQSLHGMRDIEDALQSAQKVFDQATAENWEIGRIKSALDEVADNYVTWDTIQADMTKTLPIMRADNDYSAGLRATEDVFKNDLRDNVMHIERFMDSKLPGWTGNITSRKAVMQAASDYTTKRLTMLADINKQYINSMAQGVKLDLNSLWDGYFRWSETANKNLYETVKTTLSAVDQTQLAPLEAWYKDLARVQARHQDIIREAIRIGTSEGWQDAGKAVAKVYHESANRRAGRIFGWQPNEYAQNLGHTRASAVTAKQVDEVMAFMKKNLGAEMAKPLSEAHGATIRRVGASAALDIANRAAGVGRQARANARVMTDFVMLNYNNQYGMDSMMQMVFPYEFFPTRTAFNWMRRTVRAPGAGAMMAQAVLDPKKYAEDYNMPDRLAYRIPIVIPGLDNFLENMPIVGSKIKAADLGSVYWIDPVAIMFPMSNFRQEYTDAQKRSTPLGIVADTLEQKTPLGISPFAKIIGSATGALDKDAWSNALFSGGPFGIPMTAYAKASAAWLQTGVPDGVPDSEKENYANHGFFSNSWLSRIFGISGDRYDNYRTERSVADLVATGKISPDDAWAAIKTHSGPAWEQARTAGDGAQFLATFTGWAGFRVAGSTKGEQIRIGEKVLYEKAASEGKLEEFYKMYPEYEVQEVASKGFSDPEAQKQMLDNHFYYRDVERLIQQPYQHALDQIQVQLDAIANKPNITETDNEQKTYLIDELQAIHEEQQTIRDMLDRAYPNRTQDLKLTIPPRDRALQQVASEYYDIKTKPGWTPEDLDAARQRFLSGFSPKTANESEQDWSAIFTAYQTTNASYNLRINAAYDKGSFEEGAKLRSERDAKLQQIHGIAEGRVTRYDVERYLAANSQPENPAQKEWDQANALWDVWMSYVGDKSPLTSKQQAAVSAYFRQDPLLRKHYNVGTLDIRQLNGDQLLAYARRREIKDHYWSLTTNSARIDYIQSVRHEYNQINSLLGLPPLDVLDYRPAPPDIAVRNLDAAAADFQSQNVQDYFATGQNIASSDPSQHDALSLARESGGLTYEDILRYVNPVVQRGY